MMKINMLQSRNDDDGGRDDIYCAAEHILHIFRRFAFFRDTTSSSVEGESIPSPSSIISSTTVQVFGIFSFLLG